MIYIDNPKVNQSRLKQILIHPQNYLNYHKEQKGFTEKHFRLGKYIDLALLAGDEEASRNTLVLDKFPSTTIMNKLSELLLNKSLDVKQELLEATDIQLSTYLCNQDIFGGNIKKEETKLKKINDSNMVGFLKTYLSSLLYNKNILSKEEKKESDEVIKIMREHSYSRKYFNPEFYPEGFTRLNHVQLEFSMYGFDCKAELDLVFFNDKYIIPIDLKTSSLSPTTFEYEFFKKRYDFQAAFYREALVRSGYGEGRKVLEFEFVLAPLENTKPHIFKVTKDVIEMALTGTHPYRESIVQAFNRLEHHTTTGDWDYPMEFNKGSKPILLR